VVSFINNLGLFLLRFVTGALVSIFAAREMAQRSDIIYQTLEYFNIGAPDIVKVFVGCMIMILSAMLVAGIWTRFIALVLLLLLAIGGYYWLPQASQVNFHIEALYGILFFYLFLIGGGQWAISRKRNPQSQSVLDSEQSILAGDVSPSIFNDRQDGEVVLTPPVGRSGEVGLDDEGFDESEEDKDKDNS
jgi:uncharacterized membrane protein YphA (DoxX/SURF4 family)